MGINACQYWEGYTGRKRPMCNKGDPCNQCKVKYIKVRDWNLNKHGMWTHKSRAGQMFSLDEAFGIEDPLANR